jgi:hypothetical protein
MLAVLSKSCPVDVLVIHVFAMGGPAQVARINAPLVALATIVRHLMLGRGSRTMNIFANNAVDRLHAAFVPYVAVTITIATIWPRQARFLSVNQSNIFDKSHWLPVRGRQSFEWIAMATPSTMVHLTPAVPPYGLIAPWY